MAVRTREVMDDSRTRAAHTQHDAHTALHLTSLHTETDQDKRGKRMEHERQRESMRNERVFESLRDLGSLTGRGKDVGISIF